VRRRALRSALGIACAAALAGVPASAGAFSPDGELTNFAKSFERQQHVTGTPEFQVELHLKSVQAVLARAEQLADDPERVPANVCTLKGLECAGDIRFYDWADGGDGIRKPVLFTARSGATISGHVWATRSGPARRPGVVITTGSVQAPEELYWGQAATLAKHGYVVLTYDVQGQGASDVFGEAPDESEGVPSQEGQPFYDGTEDALDFLLSAPADPYVPRPSCTSGTSHAPKQERRVAEGHNAAHNPLHDLVDSERIGIAGHSLGAAAVSFVGQKDPRVDALVAWDDLSAPDEGVFGVPECPAAPESRTSPPISKPALGISNDYGIVPTPFTADPDPAQKVQPSLVYSGAGVDSGELVIRGGCHEESALIPVGLTGVYPLSCGTLRGGDLIAWYTTAWLDKYVKGDPAADARLLSDRFRADSRGAAVDLRGDGNLFSFYFRSRFDVGLAGGGRAVCDDVRAGCPVLAPDGGPADYDFVADAHDMPGSEPPAVGGPRPEDGAAAATPAGKRKAAKRLKKKLRRCLKKKGAARKRCIKKAARTLAPR
jgi:dienelactone hydrolase